ncbi:MAG: spore germination protein [Clostridia bacterium]|nr:spore germination protein [Clostridia bacterium]
MERVDKIINSFELQSTVFRRDFTVGNVKASMLFHPDITDVFILRSVLLACSGKHKAVGLNELLREILTASEAEVKQDDSSAADSVLDGDAVIFLDKVPGMIVVNARMWEKRAVTEPPTETVVRGPREGFIEDFKTNITLVEKRLRTKSLAVEKFKIGKEGNTSVAVLYLGGIAKPELVREVRNRIKQLKIDAVSDSHYLVPCLEERPSSLFPQVGTAEKPDIVAAKLLEGRVAVIVDGSPIALTVPFLLIEDLHSGEDYYERSSFATFLRVLRLVALVLAAFLPGLYVACMTYHYEVVPLKLLITVLNALKGIPLPPMWEILFILMLFEIIREAGIRMPKSVGTAMSIVGALVLGDTAVKAGIISSPGVLIIALSSIALYTVPALVGTTGLLRILFTIIGGLGGLYGLILGGAVLVHYLSTLNSLGAPYLAPFAPLIKNDLKDGVVRAPLFDLSTRPAAIGSPNKRRLQW